MKKVFSKKCLLVCCVVLSCIILVACGASKSDYEELERRVSKLEKQLNGEPEASITGGQVQKPTSSVNQDKQKGVYDLTNLSVDEIIDDFVRFLSPNMAGKTPEEFVKGLNLRYYPNGQTDNSAYLQDNQMGSFYYFAGDGDYLENINAYSGKTA